MPTDIEEGLALINFAFVVYEASSIAGSPASSSMLMKDFLEKAKNRAIVESPKRDTEKDLPLTEHPLRMLFCQSTRHRSLAARMFFMLRRQLGSQQQLDSL
mmetsp:Transcript_17893/g.26472  ORF Transcript_17893/g.26472 Transcript_17893/m.26472 type:complete len:101 (+) Transcript_17893:132-434(+)